MRIQQNQVNQSNQLYLLVFLLLLSLGSVTALPTKAIVKRAASPTNPPPPDSDKVLAAKLETPPDKSLFWRGYVNGKDQELSSAEYAKQNDLQTIGMLKDANKVNADAAKPSLAWWNKASEHFAEGASGKVQVLAGTMGTTPGTRLEDSIWHKTELPTLTKPGKARPVKEIVSINPETKAKERTWKAGNPPQGEGSTAPPRRPTPLSPGGSTPMVKPRPDAAGTRIPAPTKRGQSQPKPGNGPPKPRPAAAGTQIPAPKKSAASPPKLPAAPKPRPAAAGTQIPAPIPVPKKPTAPRPRPNAAGSKIPVPRKPI